MSKSGKIFAVIFLALLIPVLLKAPESEAKVYRGKYENNTQWSYDTKTKTIIIDCQGSLPDDDQFSAGWRAYSKAQKVIFKKGITSIGAGACYNFQNLEEVVLPDGLKEIGYAVFYCCRNLKRINIPCTIKEVDENAFGNTSIKGFALKNAEKLGSRCFKSTKLIYTLLQIVRLVHMYSGIAKI